MDETKQPPEYGTKHFTVLTPIEGIRHRPTMYLGGVNQAALCQLVFSLVENSVDQFQTQQASSVDIRLHRDGRATVIDDGSGFAVSRCEPFTGIDPIYELFTTHHFRLPDSGSKHSCRYNTSNLAVVNACSETLIINTVHLGLKHSYQFACGEIQSSRRQATAAHSGTAISIKPDPQIFDTVEFNQELLADRFRELAYLNPGLKLKLIDERVGSEETFYSKAGLADFVAFLNQDEQPIYQTPFTVDHQEGDLRIRAAFQHIDSHSPSVAGFVREIHTDQGGTHVNGFFYGLRDAIKRYCVKHQIKMNHSVTFNRCAAGVVAVVAFDLPYPQFEGPTRSKFGCLETANFIRFHSARQIFEQLENRPAEAAAIVQRVKEQT